VYALLIFSLPHLNLTSGKMAAALAKKQTLSLTKAAQPAKVG
jgi:hypothetical protein